MDNPLALVTRIREEASVVEAALEASTEVGVVTKAEASAGHLVRVSGVGFESLPALGAVTFDEATLEASRRRVDLIVGEDVGLTV